MADLYRAFADLADDIGLPSLARDIRVVRLPRLEEERLFVVVLGEFNHGKSTFLNALLGESVLPVGATPTTGALCQIRYGEIFSARAHWDSGRTLDLERAVLADWLRGREPDRTGLGRDTGDRLSHIELTLPAALLADRVTLVDTPGVNDLSEQRADITYGHVPRADVVLFLLDATQVLTASERRFLSERVLRQVHDRLVFVVAKADLLSDRERAEVEAFARAELSALVADPRIFFVSARLALDGARAASGLDPLLDYLRGLLAQDRLRLVLDHALADGKRLSRFFRQTLNVREAALCLPAPELAARVRKVEAELQAGQRALDAATTALRAEAAAHRAYIRQAQAAFVTSLLTCLPGELAAAEPEDVEHYLGPFLEDTFRTFIERTGEDLAPRLEATAEKIVAVASENLDHTTCAVSSAIGQTASDLRLERPDLSAEASLFALGTLGGAALMFVNTLLGGTVTLLTPALAALARARAARAAKAEAIAQVPDWIRKLSAEVEPRLVGIVDTFEARMESFLCESGATLSRGIAEVLEHVMRESEAAGAPDPGARRLRDLHSRLAALEARTDEVRAALWHTSETV